MELWWSWLLTVWGLTAMWLAGRGLKVGWLVALTLQAAWITYGLVKREWGFIFGGAAYAVIHAVNYVKWHRRERERLAEPSGEESG